MRRTIPKPAKAIEAAVRHGARTIPGPEIDPDAPLQMLVTKLDWSDYVGRIAIGRIQSGTITHGQPIALMQAGRSHYPAKSRSVTRVRQAGPRRSRRSHGRRHRGARRPGTIEIGDTISDPEDAARCRG